MYRTATIVALAIALIGSFATAASAHDKKAGTISAIGAHIDTKPGLVIDLTQKSGEYCLNYGFGNGGVMTHYSADPTATTEDTIDFVDARPLIEAGLDVATLARHDGTLRSMQPNVWYYLPAGEFEPHHAAKLPFPILMRASNLQ